MSDNFAMPALGGGGASGPTSKEFGRSSAEVSFNYTRGADSASAWVPAAIIGVVAIVALLILKK